MRVVHMRKNKLPSSVELGLLVESAGVYRRQFYVGHLPFFSLGIYCAVLHMLYYCGDQFTVGPQGVISFWLNLVQ